MCLNRRMTLPKGKYDTQLDKYLIIAGALQSKWNIVKQKITRVW